MVVQDNHSDAPLLPIAALERLQRFTRSCGLGFGSNPNRGRNQKERAYRINTFVSCERIAWYVVRHWCMGILGGIYAALNGHDWLGGIIATATICTLARFLLHGKFKSENNL